jgi:branched-chain amino acid transport system ATP-binding protein
MMASTDSSNFALGLSTTASSSNCVTVAQGSDQLSTIQTTPLLELKDINSGYGMSQVLFDMSLRVMPGQFVSLQGRNGMGKSTTIRSIMAQLAQTSGHVLWKGQRIDHLVDYQIARLGIGLVPEGRQIFPNLTVWENLVATARASKKTTGWNIERVYAFFPCLAERAKNFGNQLSGGEQQMLAIGRALMTNPELLILDEATEGLSPLLRQEIWQTLAALREAGLSILVTDKNLKQLLTLCDQHFIIEKGQCVWSGDSVAFRSDPTLKQRYLVA